MTACHLIADTDLSLLCNVYSDGLVNTRTELVGILSGKYLSVYDNTVGSVRYLEGGIPYLSCFLTENSSEKPLLRSKLGLSLRSYLSYQNIPGAYLGADTDDSVLVEVLEGIIADTRNILRYLLRSKLGISCLTLILFDMDRGVYVILNKSLREKNRILIVVALPGHEADERVLSESDLTV